MVIECGVNMVNSIVTGINPPSFVRMVIECGVNMVNSIVTGINPPSFWQMVIKSGGFMEKEFVNCGGHPVGTAKPSRAVCRRHTHTHTPHILLNVA
jgi:hypothetical protein